MDECNRMRTDIVLISFDFEKAFDTVEHQSILQALKAFGFGENFIEMTKIVFCQPETYILNNGFWSKPIFPTRGCQQGCCYSAGAFNIVAKILGLAIRQNQDIKGLTLNNMIVKLGQFADDLWTVSKASGPQINEILIELIHFAKFSRLHVNPEKCAILRIGPWYNSDAKYYTLKRLFWSPGPIKILGIWIYPNDLIMYHENFIDMLEVIEDKLNSWQNRNLTLLL